MKKTDEKLNVEKKSLSDTYTLTIRIPKSLAPFLDEYCSQYGLNRGKYVADLIRKDLSNKALEAKLREDYAGKKSLSVDDVRDVLTRIISDAKF